MFISSWAALAAAGLRALARAVRPPALARTAHALAVAVVLAALAPAPGHAHGDGDKGAGKVRAANLDAVRTDFGQTGDPKRVTRTVRLKGDDTLRFTPARFTVRQGDTLRFVFTNTGRLKHEAVLGTAQDLAKHAALMQQFPAMEHDEPFMAHAAPGQSAEMVWQFTQPGEFLIGCLMPGHFEGGMRATVIVEPRPRGR